MVDQDAPAWKPIVSPAQHVSPQEPLPRRAAARAIGRCLTHSVRLLVQRRTHLSKRKVGLRLHFGDGSAGQVFRETVVDGRFPADPCVLVVGFKLRLVRGRWHKLFLWECILNTPLFVGFPGFVSKLWVDRDEQDRYRGWYEWSDPAEAEFYARSLWRVLEVVCVPHTIQYEVVPGFGRDDLLNDPRLLDAVDIEEDAAWWRLVAVSPFIST